MATREDNIKKINAELEKLSDEQLDEVAGGTVDELKEIVEACTKNRVWRLFGEVATAGTQKYGSNTMAKDVMLTLLNMLGIKADIHIGLGRQGFFALSNTYTDKATGESLSHREVIERINNYTF